MVLDAASILELTGLRCGRSLMVSRPESVGFARRGLRCGGPANLWSTSPGLRGLLGAGWSISHGMPCTTVKARQHHVGEPLTCKQYSHLTLAGKPAGLFSLLDEYLLAPVWLLRQLPEDKLVAAVDTLRMLPLLYRVNAEVDVPALDIELRQFDDAIDDAIELALEARGRPLRVLVGEMPRLLTGDTAR